MKAATLFDLDEPTGDADISPCGLYRYTLTRRWSDGPTVNFVLLNPSKADATRGDNTLARLIPFAKAWGFGALIVTNLYAYRSTDPRGLQATADPIGPGNDAAIRRAAADCELVVCGWGNHAASGRAAQVARMIRDLGRVPHALRLTGLGQPTHPLRLKGDLVPFPMAG